MCDLTNLGDIISNFWNIKDCISKTYEPIAEVGSQYVISFNALRHSYGRYSCI